jgi:hypothetical protein
MEQQTFSPECPVCNDEMKWQGLKYASECGFSAPAEVAKGFKSKVPDFGFDHFDLRDIFGGKNGKSS